MKNPSPYIRQRPDAYWEIVFRDEKTGRTRRKATGTKTQTVAEEILQSFTPNSCNEAPNPYNTKLRRRKDGYWESTWTENGRIRRKSHGTKSDAQALAAHDVFCLELAKPEIPARPKVAWVLDQYYSYICREKAETTSSAMAANIDTLKERLGHLFWDEIIQDVVDDYIVWRMQKPRWSTQQKHHQQFGMASRNTACKDLRVLRAALTRARKNRYTGYPPDFSIVEGDPVRETKSWLTMEELTRMIAACEPRQIEVNGKKLSRNTDRSHIEAFLLIALATGARKEAILSLRWDQIYIPEPVLEFVATKPPEAHDTQGRRAIPLNARKALGSEMLNFATGEHVKGVHIDFGTGHGNKRRPAIPIGRNWRLMNYLLYGGDRSQPYVISYNGKPVKSLKKGLAQVAKEAGVTKTVSHHTMKRTSITHMVRAGIPFNIIADTVNTTEDVLKKYYSMHRPDIEEALGDALSIN